MSERAYERVATQLAAAAGLDVVTINAEGLRRVSTGANAAEADPEIYWLSVDLYRDGLLADVLAMMQSGANARWGQVFAAGLDDPAFRAVMARGVRLTKSDAQAAPIAEYVVAHALSLLHPIAEQHAAQREHDWRRIEFTEIAATRWLLVGFGAIGRGIAARLRPFGAHVTVVRQRPELDPLADAVCTQGDLSSALPTSDVVVLCCPLTVATRGMADARFFAAMKPGALFVNVARGDLVDEEALRCGLTAGKPSHAVLDVFGTEPLPDDAWQWDHPGVRVTAHAANAGRDVLARADALFFDNLARYRAGAPLRLEATPAEPGL